MYELFLPETEARTAKIQAMFDHLSRLPEHTQGVAMHVLEGVLPLAER